MQQADRPTGEGLAALAAANPIACASSPLLEAFAAHAQRVLHLALSPGLDLRLRVRP